MKELKVVCVHPHIALIHRFSFFNSFIINYPLSFILSFFHSFILSFGFAKV